MNEKLKICLGTTGLIIGTEMMIYGIVSYVKERKKMKDFINVTRDYIKELDALIKIEEYKQSLFKKGEENNE